MTVPVRRIEELERANYRAMLPTAQVTPGLDVLIRDDVVITRSVLFPTPDANHACLLRVAEEQTDRLLDEIEEMYAPHGLPTTIAISSACLPADWTTRLERRGYVAQREREAWMVLENVSNLATPDPFEGVEVRQIDAGEAAQFARVFLDAFQMPGEYAPYMAELLEPSVGLPDSFHYLALVGNEPVGTFSLLRHGRFGVIGSAGVVESHRRSGAATNLMICSVRESQRLGIDTLLQQTTANTTLERLLRITGFQTLFTRTYYVSE
ncbi:MAG: GNAT family N-acetyltransferase [Chloroflexi bacterium]|nr:GNAT family N-acetyltransferase [Chloroflexota bacterium]